MKKDGKPDWAKWRQMPEWELWEAVALSLGFEPSLITWGSSGLHASSLRGAGGSKLGVALERELTRRATILERVAKSSDPEQFGLTFAGGSPPFAPGLTSSVRPTDFLRWVRQTAPDWTIPPELVDMAAHSKSAARVTSDDQHANGVGTSARWPWGSYETKLLGVMAEAVHELWSTYDPDQPETAPTQPDVVKFIKQRLTEVGYANPDAIATAMATIIRHEKAPTGRRRKARH